MEYRDWPPTQHQPALSHTNVETYTLCPRKWFLQYQWRYIPGDICYDIAMQRAMVPANMLAGCIVDTVITMAIRRYMTTGIWRTDLRADARKAMVYYDAYSRQFKSWTDRRVTWKKPEKQWVRAIDMIVYEGEISQSHTAATWKNVDECLDRFVDFMKGEGLYDADPGDWRLDDGTPSPWFWCGDVPAYANYDFAVMEGTGVRVIDWKTGRSETGESTARSQLLWYGAYAAQEWEIDPSRVTLHAVWLRENGKVTRAPFDQERLRGLGARLSALYLDQGAAVTDLQANPTDYEQIFPLTEDVRQCFWCRFKSCVGRKRLANLMYDQVAKIEVEGPDLPPACP